MAIERGRSRAFSLWFITCGCMSSALFLPVDINDHTAMGFASHHLGGQSRHFAQSDNTLQFCE